MKTRKRSKHWLVFIAAALALHLVLLLYVKPAFFSIFKQSPRVTTEAPSRGRAAPDAILYIPIEIDDTNDEKPIDRISEEAEIEKIIEPTDEQTFPRVARPSSEKLDIDNILGDGAETLPQSPGAQVVKIPPRPLEITWPDTQDLQHCLGHHIDVRIQVGEKGEIIQVQPPGTDHPPDCLSAALESARRIVFAPGKINGRPARMWTKIRIDFQGKK